MACCNHSIMDKLCLLLGDVTDDILLRKDCTKVVENRISEWQISAVQNRISNITEQYAQLIHYCGCSTPCKF